MGQPRGRCAAVLGLKPGASGAGAWWRVTALTATSALGVSVLTAEKGAAGPALTTRACTASVGDAYPAGMLGEPLGEPLGPSPLSSVG